MKKDKWDAARYARVRTLACFIGITAKSPIWRYVSFLGSILCLALSGLLFGPDFLLASVTSFAIAFGLVFLLIYFWFLDEDRKRRVMFGELGPRPDDGKNSDMRDEVVVACAALFMLTPALLQTLNPSLLHLSVAPDYFGLAHQDPSGFASHHPRFIDLVAWFVFSLWAFINTFPVVGYILPTAQDVTGISTTQQTPHLLAPALELLFAVFLGSIVYGQIGRIGNRIEEAVGALRSTPAIAAAIGPVVLKALFEKLKTASDRTTLRNAVTAVGDLAERYAPVRETARAQVSARLLDLFAQVPLPVKGTDLENLALLVALTRTFCRIDFTDGIDAVSSRMVQGSESYAARSRIADELARDLDITRAIRVFDRAQQTSPGGNIEKRIRNHLEYLRKQLDTAEENSGGTEESVTQRSHLDKAA